MELEQTMKLILVDQQHGHTKTIVLKGWMKGFLSLCLLGAPVALGYFGYQLSATHTSVASIHSAAQDWEQQLQLQLDQLANAKLDSEQQIEALTIRLAMLQARLLRLDAMGERITDIAGLEDGEFDFSETVVPMGGPSNAPQVPLDGSELTEAVAQLEQQLNNRQAQLEILERVLVDQQNQSEVFLTGRPIEEGWLSSRFGQRNDPFTGRRAFHSGVDFATRSAGANINSVASGVVTWAGDRSGYGEMIEVNHGNGYVTRYAHAQELLADVGDIVKKGDTIALVGSTGRSTGPHVHFEVYKNGRVVDPASYINRTVR